MFEFPKQMKKVFKDDALQAEFEANGYVVLPYYTDEEVAYLLSLYRKLHPQDEKGFFPSTFSKDKEYRQKADEEIRATGNRSMEKYLVDYKTVCGSYIVKSPGKDSIMEVHQDMTLVDEAEFTGINIWCPLVDLTMENGMLFALSGSHRFFPTYRGASLPTLYENVYDEVKQYSKALKLKAGEAVIFDQSIMHYSLPNESDSVRPVTNTYFTHKDARFQICHYDQAAEAGKIEVFEQDDSFMTNFEQFGENIMAKPKIGKSLGHFDYDFPKLTPEFLHKKYGSTEIKEPTFIDKIKAFFS